MTLLKDDELVDLCNSVNPIVRDLQRPPTLVAPSVGGAAMDPWYGPESAIQPSSIDLHIGTILQPGAKENNKGSISNPREEYTLELGQTVVILTKEQLNLPNNIAAFGFPPAHLSSRGLLMTNPGHVDPGYVGLIRFTVMNIAREGIALRRGDPIVTLLFFRLSGDARGYAQRRNLTAPILGPRQSDVDCLSPDFLDVNKRADAAAKRAIKQAELRVKLWGILAPVILTLAIALVGVWPQFSQFKADLEQVKKVLELREAKSRLDKIDDMEKLKKRIDELEGKLNRKSGSRSTGSNP